MIGRFVRQSLLNDVNETQNTSLLISSSSQIRDQLYICSFEARSVIRTDTKIMRLMDFIFKYKTLFVSSSANF